MHIIIVQGCHYTAKDWCSTVLKSPFSFVVGLITTKLICFDVISMTVSLLFKIYLVPPLWLISVLTFPCGLVFVCLRHMYNGM